MSRSVLIVAFLLFSQACFSDTNEYIGTWSNREGGLGGMLLDIEQQGDHLLAKLSLIDNGANLGTYEARVANGYLYMDDHAIFKKMFYSKSDNRLITLGDSPPGPFHKIEKQLNLEPSNADALTAFFTKGPCTLEKNDWCAKSAKSENNTTFVFGETEKTLESLQFNYALFQPLCFLIKTAIGKSGVQALLSIKENKGLKRELLLSTVCS